MKWTETNFWAQTEWYHATNYKGLLGLLERPLALFNMDKWPLDFGPGFYLCPNKEWSNKYLRKNFGEGYVVKFHFTPSEYLGKFSYKFFPERDDELAEFIFRNRMDWKGLRPTTAITGGPMSDGRQDSDFEEYEAGGISKEELFRRLLLPTEDWQLVLHSQALCDRLVIAEIVNERGENYDPKDA